ncbi:MAG: CheR family methyltransferase [Bacillota bacterium]
MDEKRIETLEIIKILKHTYDLDVSMFAESFVEKTLHNRIHSTTQEINVYFSNLVSGNKEEAILLRESLQNNFSDFFRDSSVFAQLERKILPKLIEENKNQREIRVWSAGCSTGQEPYSIAMLLEDYMSFNGEEFRYRIIATDNSETALEYGRNGEYLTSEIQNLKLKHINKYFTEQGENHLISEKIRDNVKFYTYDVLDQSSVSPYESVFGDFDLVICCNLLIYYKQDIQKFIINKLANSLSDSGYLILGNAEQNLVRGEFGLKKHTGEHSIFHKKTGR